MVFANISKDFTPQTRVAEWGIRAMREQILNEAGFIVSLCLKIKSMAINSLF